MVSRRRREDQLSLTESKGGGECRKFTAAEDIKNNENIKRLSWDSPRSPWSLCGSVVEHRSAVSEGLRFDSSWGLRIFSLSHARDKTNKNLSLHFNYFSVSQNKQVIFYSHYIKLILLVRSRQLDISIVSFFAFF